MSAEAVVLQRRYLERVVMKSSDDLDRNRNPPDASIRVELCPPTGLNTRGLIPKCWLMA